MLLLLELVNVTDGERSSWYLPQHCTLLKLNSLPHVLVFHGILREAKLCTKIKSVKYEHSF